MEFRRLVAAAVLTLSSAAAFAAPATYIVHSNYTAPSFSASWLHAADGCNMNGLFMCGAKQRITSGKITGNQTGGVLNVTGGELVTASQTVTITGGTIGGAFDWRLDTSIGTFQFVDLITEFGFYTSSNQPNSFNTTGDPNNMVLWGQNFERNLRPASGAWGVDIYATRVPAPSTALIVAGACALVLLRRRRLIETRRNVA